MTIRNAAFSRRVLLKGLAFGAMAWLSGCNALGATARSGAAPDPRARSLARSRRWNVVTVVTDDQAIWAMGAYGNRDIRTPVLDGLAASGVRFTNAFATSGVCTPSRVSILTGRHSLEIGTLHDAIRDEENEGLPADVPSWPREFRRAGYATALFGKWHLGSHPRFYPESFGYDEFFGFLGGGTGAINPALTHRGTTRIVEGYTDDVVTDQALSWIESQAGHRRPFCLSLHLRNPHHPRVPLPRPDADAAAGVEVSVPDLDKMTAAMPQLYSDAFRGVAKEAFAEFFNRERRDYYGSIHGVDRNVGKLLGKLAALGLENDTIVVFTSDQGYFLGERGLIEKGSAFPFTAGLLPDMWYSPITNLYDLTLRVPLLIRWPGVVPPGTVNDELVSLIDLYPTLLGMASVEQRSPVTNEARDISTLLLDEKPGWRSEIFAQYTSDQVGNLEFLRMVRTKEWKLVRSQLNYGRNQLFNLAEDPDELKNLYYPPRKPVTRPGGELVIETPPDRYAGVRAGLQASLQEWQEMIGDPALGLERLYKSHNEKRRRRYQ